QRVPQPALADPDLALPLQVDRDRGELHRQRFDQRVADDLPHGLDQAAAAQQARTPPAGVEHAQEIAPRHRPQALLEFAQLAGGEDAADQGPARRTAYGLDPEAAFLQHLDHADLRQPARAARAN